jgi:hypothetical protein
MPRRLRRRLALASLDDPDRDVRNYVTVDSANGGLLRMNAPNIGATQKIRFERL